MSSPGAILVVGAGPTGLTAAIELARRGYRPRIVDAAAGPPAESRALGVNPRTLAILEPCGATRELLAAGEKRQAACLRTRDRVLVTFDLGLIPGPYPFMLVLPQGDAERILARTLDGLGIRVEREVSLTALEMAEGPVLATLEHAAGRTEHVEAELLIGADGAHSAVRKALGVPFEGSAYETAWGLADVCVETQLPLDRLHAFDLSPVLLGVIPIRGDRVRLVSDHADVLAHVPPEVRVREVIWQSTFRIAHRQVRSYQRGPVFLAGDAAHIHSPFGARGMNLGIEDAAWLAWLIAEGRTERYTADRKPVGRHVLRFVDPATRFISADGLWARAIRRGVLPRLMRSRMLQRAAVRRVAGLDTPSPPWLDGHDGGRGTLRRP